MLSGSHWSVCWTLRSGSGLLKASSLLEAHLTRILLLPTTFSNFTINSHDIWIERGRKERGMRPSLLFSPLFSCNAHISIAYLPGSARVNVHNSQGHAPSKTSDLNFQPDVTSSTPWTITKTRLWPHTNLSERSPGPSSSSQSQKRRCHWGCFFVLQRLNSLLCVSPFDMCERRAPACFSWQSPKLASGGWHYFKPQFSPLRQPDGAQARSVSPLACSDWEVINSYSFTDCWKWLPP